MIEIKSIHKYFKSFHALKGIDLNVQKGEIYGFIGHNGAGKSTTMNIITGLSRPSSGECFVNGINIYSIKHPGDLRIGYLPEEPKFYPWLTAYETLDYLGNGSGHGVSKQRIDEMLDWIGLRGSSHRRVAGFSRGMRQRLGIGAALIHNPELVVLDEPSSALDPEGRSDVLNLITDLKKMGKTIFFSTHILDDAERICDRVGILSQGRIVLEKPLENLLNENISPVTDIELREAEPLLEDKIKGIEGVLEVKADKNRISVTTSHAGSVSSKLLGLLSEAKVPIVSIARRKQRLEDIFIKEVNQQ